METLQFNEIKNSCTGTTAVPRMIPAFTSKMNRLLPASSIHLVRAATYCFARRAIPVPCRVVPLSMRESTATLSGGCPARGWRTHAREVSATSDHGDLRTVTALCTTVPTVALHVQPWWCGVETQPAASGQAHLAAARSGNVMGSRQRRR